MRILQLGRFWHSQHGGVERHAELLSRRLATSGYDVVNLVASIGGSSSDTRQEGYRLVQVPTYGTFARTPIAPAQIWRALQLHREDPFDLMHMHFPDPLAHLTSLLMPKSVARVISWHSDIVKQKRLLRLYQPFLSRVTRRADAVIAATQSHFDVSSQIPHELPAERMHVIPYGLEFGGLLLGPQSQAKHDEILARASDRPVLFALGRHVYYKGFDVLIESMRQVDALLFIGGEGPLRSQLMGQARSAGLCDRIVFVGRIPEVELPAYFHACDVFCLPSIEQSEAFGLVQLEAMACGKPVVCTQLGNGVNVVHQHGVTGWAVPPRDPKALADALRGMLDDKNLREKMGQAARARAWNNYSVEAMTRRHIELYESLLIDGRNYA